MLYYDKQVTQSTEIYIWKVEEDFNELATLSGCDSDTDYRVLNEKRKKEWACVRYLLFRNYPDLIICYQASGKPYLKDKKKDKNNKVPSISISHTSDYVSIMLNKDHKDIGLDIEKRKNSRVLNVADRFMSEKERAEKPTNDDTINALLVWTAKEALYKLADIKYIDYIKDFHIENINIYKGTGNGIITELINGNTYKVNFIIEPEFVMAWIEN